MMQFPINAKEIIPHRAAMLLLDELSFSSPDFMEGKAIIQSGNLFVSSRGLDGACFVELLAQLAAAGDGWESVKEGIPVRSGFLVGVNDFTITGKAAAGDTLHLKLRKGLQLNNFILVEGEVYRGTDIIAKGNLKLFVTDRSSEVLNTGEDNPADGVPENNGASESVIHEYFRKNLADIDLTRAGNPRAKIRFLDDFPGFRGHFPGYPIVPGVVLLHLPVVLCEKVFSCPMILADVERAKFARQVLPGDTVETDLNVQQNADLFTIKAGLTVEGKTAASFVIKTRRYL